eukprot:TRINITY_DN632_c0_g1_i1.p2 TRINITY_DN632_c0_g1~~TRINITY_DN632_c0_g1_i1.p2  ORF type:complete len:662 (-),score=167.00 TRINITY_DN632_c0_g1_i1:2165-4015(-)
MASNPPIENPFAIATAVPTFAPTGEQQPPDEITAAPPPATHFTVVPAEEPPEEQPPHMIVTTSAISGGAADSAELGGTTGGATVGHAGGSERVSVDIHGSGVGVGGGYDFADDGSVKMALAPGAGAAAAAASGSAPAPNGDDASHISVLDQRAQKAKEHITIACAVLVAVLCAGVILLYLRFILVPLVLAKFLQYMLEPVVNWLYKGRRPCSKRAAPGACHFWSHANFGVFGRNIQCSKTTANNCRQCWVFGRTPYSLAVTLSLVLALGIVVAVGYLVVYSFGELVNEKDKYLEQGNNLLSDMVDWMNDNGWNITKDDVVNSIKDNLSIGGLAMSFADFLYTTVSDISLMLLFLVYMLYERTTLPIGKKSARNLVLMEQMNMQIRHYISAMVLISSVVGFLIGLILMILKVDLALVFGFLTFILNMIPNFGPIIAWLMPMPVVLLDPTKNWVTIILVLLLPGSVHMVIGNVVAPKILGNAVDLHPVTVLAALCFWAVVWGAVGAILSVPLVAVLKVWCDHVEHPLFRNIGRIMGHKNKGTSAAAAEAKVAAAAAADGEHSDFSASKIDLATGGSNDIEMAMRHDGDTHAADNGDDATTVSPSSFGPTMAALPSKLE